MNLRELIIIQKESIVVKLTKISLIIFDNILQSPEMKGENLNRIKAVLAERKITQKELAEFLKVTPGAVSTWCRNFKQPDIQTLFEIAAYIKVEASSLISSMEAAGYTKNK